ncbi:MAG: helix-turn-helix domain-containing protein [Lachnospiraceae bacterium]|nr:helix-turn-helix domain-containing protein [Lachnospiraceae bacterium]
MDLLKLCQKITFSDPTPIEKSLELGARYLNAGFMDTTREIQQYRFPFETRKAYLYIWNFYAPDKLKASICPECEDRSFTCQFSPGQNTSLHVQDFIELAYVVKGELRQKILDKDIVFHEGEFCLIDKNCVHQDYLLDNESLILFLCLRNDALTEIMDENVTTQKIIAFLQAALLEQKDLQQYVHFRPIGNVRQEMEMWFYLLAKELFEDKTGSLLIIKGLLMRIFRLLSTEYDFQLSRQQKKDMQWAVFAEVCRYMEKNYRTVTIQELSKVFHFQEDYFNRLIKKRTGKTYCELLQEIRLLKAEYLLNQTAMTVSEIAEEVGYRNKGYFYKLFSKKYGMKPAEYRKQL